MSDQWFNGFIMGMCLCNIIHCAGQIYKARKRKKKED